jgi:hypothetical protein
VPLDSSFITTVDEYDGGTSARVRATQLPSSFSASAARRVVDQWVDFLSSGPSPIAELEFCSRTPKRLFAALAGQSQLTSLTVKWGDYTDLSSLSALTGLTRLHLRGAGNVTSVDVLASLTALTDLAIEGFKDIRVTEPLGALVGLRVVELGGQWMSSRNGHVGSIGFLRATPLVQDLLLHTVIVDDLDYTPLLSLPELTSVRVMKVRGMTPPHEQLVATLPWRA